MASSGSIVRTSGGIEGAGAGGGLGLNAPGAGPKVTHFAAGGSKSDGPSMPAELEEAWNNLLADDNCTCVVFATYSGTKALQMAFVGPEEGPPGGCGLDLLKTQLREADTACGWAGFRCNAVDNRQNTISKRSKVVFVQWMPDGAAAMRKARMGSHKGAMKQVMHGSHCDVLVTDVDELTPAMLVNTLQAATGAHKPNGYEFNEGEVTDADYYKDL